MLRKLVITALALAFAAPATGMALAQAGGASNGDALRATHSPKNQRRPRTRSVRP